MSTTDPQAPRVHYRICPLCEACCGLEVQTSGDRVVSIRGAQDDPFSHGFLCPKGVSLKDLHEDPDRLRQPLIRRNGRHEPIGWDEAFEEIERRLQPLIQAHGPDAVALSFGNPAAHKVGLLAYTPRLARALGTRNVFSASTLDQMPKQLSSALMYGHWLSIPVPDLPRTDLLVVLGANPMVSNGSLWTVPDFRGKARALRERGGRLIVIDPRRTETAAVADEHHFIRPGSDVWLLLGLVHTLFDEDLVRTGALGPWIEGLDAVRAAVTAYPPESTAAHCGIPAAEQRRLARLLATTPRASLYARIGSCTQRHGTLNSWLVDVINILCGQLDRPGGAMFPKAAAFAVNTQGRPGSGRGVTVGRRRSRVSGAPEVFGELPMVCLAEEIETPGEGQVRALITVASNPVLSAPNGPRLARALDGLDFMLSLDIYLNETSRHADLILPAPSPLEDLHYDIAFGQLSWRNHARYSEPVFPPPAGMPEEWETLTRLAALVSGADWRQDAADLDTAALRQELRHQLKDGDGAQTEALLGALAPRVGPARLVDLALRGGPYGDQFGARPDGLTLDRVQAAPHGLDLGELQPRMPELLRTPSGRIELAPAPFLDALAALPAQQPPSAAAGELLLIGRRDLRSGNSWMHNLPVLAKGPDRSALIVHPEDARQRGLRDGERAQLRNAAGATLEVLLHCSDEMMPGVASLPHGWGHELPGTQLSVARLRPGANLNALLDDGVRDPLSGNAVLSGQPVTLAALPA
ncbi:molybdopterin-dependent oxidoreductase [Pelomonas sp. APW6]|uniref:Molybdopterin-dependent oxidoreductase n=1 Tax=Roseateles subflavus TaxID=3053353 RepID=A0ABT7LIT7_9BURK|nr:molybdopterin-dependent oxidoreductase [Pelomonas sp. APW6]MDL5031545.1 molybdopterin-dependent oxidoreductase [Pelomonas sp. APW6]